MMIENINLVHFSPVFHTRALVRGLGNELARELGTGEPVEFDLTLRDGRGHKFTGDDLVILGMPVYGGRVPELAARRLDGFTGSQTPALVLASYGNREFDDALLELGNLAVKRGFVPIGGAACVAQHTIVSQCGSGRPDAADWTSIKKFAHDAAALLKKSAWSPVELPGNFPYRDYKSAPLPQYVEDTCIQCGVCARDCPNAAINPENVWEVYADRCICCMRCINVCPVQARHPKPEFMAAVSAKLLPLCAGRKENSFYLGKEE